ncbi:hypothetical protein HYALB_00008655 [Hymenoscyphus albidus]|uniref:Uncharacterized protein n=1 Tax=Hymenoscyphus albidus TaxID=595503 RepID=A0A9N9LCK2_9HELO|nr:hypothetical protein HYALB_00008655 [Hymenoscyphus albidus]
MKCQRTIGELYKHIDLTSSSVGVPFYKIYYNHHIRLAQQTCIPVPSEVGILTAAREGSEAEAESKDLVKERKGNI